MSIYKNFPFKEDDKLNGVFTYLNQKRLKTFRIEATVHETVPLTTAYDITERDNSENFVYWASARGSQEMIISFRKPILFTGYTFENAGSPYSWMMSWTIFGSNDRSQWENIDHQEDEIFCQNNSTHPTGFICAEPNPRSNISYLIKEPKYYSHIKIQNDKNSVTGNYIILRSLEFFGFIPYSYFCSRQCKYSFFHLSSCFIALVLK